MSRGGFEPTKSSDFKSESLYRLGHLPKRITTFPPLTCCARLSQSSSRSRTSALWPVGRVVGEGIEPTASPCKSEVLPLYEPTIIQSWDSNPRGPTFRGQGCVPYTHWPARLSDGLGRVITPSDAPQLRICGAREFPPISTVLTYRLSPWCQPRPLRSFMGSRTSEEAQFLGWFKAS
jgi:hypothetical protein